MSENQDQELSIQESTEIESREKPSFTANLDSDFDFEITVRKLELPVHPRGVLAE